jgi:hypothetical protein
VCATHAQAAANWLLEVGEGELARRQERWADEQRAVAHEAAQAAHEQRLARKMILDRCVWECCFGGGGQGCVSSAPQLKVSAPLRRC